VALVDPALTYTMPQAVTASTGLDALTQLIEPYTSSRHNPLTDMITQAGLVRVRSLRAAYADPNDKQAREDMAFASLCGGLALANAGLGAVHGFAAVLGAKFAIPHGVCCAALLPYTLKGNVDALMRRAPASPFLERYRIAAQILTGKNGADALTTIDNMLQLIVSMCNEMKIPNISAFGVTEDLFPSIVEQAQKASSMKANPIKLTDEELTAILKEAL
jgi:alcohol dehydrogenase class IV